MAKRGAPTKFIPEITTKVIQGIENGLTQEGAAALAGISPSCLDKWLAKGRAAKSGAFYDFVREVQRARASAIAKVEVRFMKNVMNESDPRAQADWLARRHPKRWSKQRQIQVEHSGETRTSVVKVEAPGSESELEAYTQAQQATLAASMSEARDVDASEG